MSLAFSGRASAVRPAAAGSETAFMRCRRTDRDKLRTVRTIAAFAVLYALGASRAVAQPGAALGTAQLQISGARLALYSDSLTTDAEQTINVGEAARVRTCYGTGAVCGAAAPGSVPGLKVVGDLSGPELPQALPYETAPGGTFFLPGFQREGDYLLSNIRLVETSSGRVLTNAEPSLATLHVRQILLASATVTRLTLADLQARGIAITQQNFQAFDTVQSVVRSDGATLTYTYDAGNRVTKRTGQGGSVVPGGETFTWDIASRLGSATRVNDKGDPIAGTAVVMGGYDLAGRPQSETVGARAALTRDYDVFGHVTSLGLPPGVGAFGALSYLRAYEPGTQRLSSLTATGDAPSVPGVALASLGAKWAWLGEDRLLGVTSNGPLGAAHRFGYVGGPGGPAGAAKWKLGTLTIGTAGGSDPFADAGLPLGDAGGKGSKPWGQFAYGYVTGASGDGTKLGRQVTGTGLPIGSILAGQGWAYGIDPSKRLKGAFAGPGDVRGIDAGGAAAAIAAFERFTYDYGAADQLNSQTREVAVKTVAYETGGEGRPDSRKADAGPKLAFSYDGAKRRTADDRFTYEWHWHGKLASAVVKPCWPIENGESQDPGCPAGYTRPPYADQKIAYEYDTLGRLLTRTHLGVLPSGETDDSKRPFIEVRAYLWDDKVLLAETAYADLLETQIRWRKSFIPGASLDDHVQLRVETYDPSGRSVATDRLYSYLRDEQNTVLGLADETSDPVRPSTPLRYLYTPYGDAHAETGPEARRAAYQSDVTSVTKPDTTVASQAIADPTHFLGGAIRITTSADLDQGTFNTIALERLDSSVWTPLTGGEFVTGRGTTATNAQLDVLPLAGFELGKSYRVRVATGLHDVGGRALSDARVLTFTLPDPVPPDQIGTLNFAYERIFPVNYDSYFASGTDAGLIPGGQPMLFQGAWTDPVTGLQYKRERFYDPRNAGWLSQDPLGDRDSPNLYGFVGARPHEKTDPLGLEASLANNGTIVIADVHTGRIRRISPAEIAANGDEVRAALGLEAGLDPRDADTMMKRAGGGAWTNNEKVTALSKGISEEVDREARFAAKTWLIMAGGAATGGLASAAGAGAAVAGAAGGVGGLGTSDVIEGHLSTPGAYVGAAVGGAILGTFFSSSEGVGSLNLEPPPAPSLEYNIAPHGEQPRPSRPYASHHGVQRKYLEENVPGYSPNEDPTIMLNDQPGGPHRRISGIQARERAAIRRETGDPYSGDYGQWRARAIDQMRRNGVPEEKIGQWLLEHDGYLFGLDH
jgi:RHS repeat-associated protein